MFDIVVPTEQEGTRAVVKSWLKKIGDTVRVDDPVAELETDKVAVEIAAVGEGVLAEILFEEGAEVEPGAVLGRIAPGGTNGDTIKAGAGETSAQLNSDGAAAVASSTNRGTEQLPPGIRRLLTEHGLQAGDIPVSGLRLTREDVEAEIARRSTPAGNKPAKGTRSVPHDTMRKRIAEHMAQSLATAPHVTSVFEADFSAITMHRAANKQHFEQAGANLTFTVYFIAAAAKAMEAAPAVNGRWYEDRIDIFDDINIGVGTALGEKGLIVPVIHRVQGLSLLEIASELSRLTEKARGGALAQTDVRGGTFSISNHGVSGSLLASPIIINQPQSAILGVGALQKRAVVRSEDGVDTVHIRPMAYVTLTIDHRVVDAFQTNAWLAAFVRTIETWPLDRSD